MEDYVIEDRFSDLNERINRLNGLVSIILDTLGKQTSEIGLLKTMVNSLNTTVNTELVKNGKMDDLIRRNSKWNADDNDGDVAADLLSSLTSKDKMSD